MKFLRDFKDFAVKGNVIDLAVGVIIGAAFGKIVSSAVEDLIMPPIGKVVGNLDFTNLYIPLSEKIHQAQLAGLATNADFRLPLADAKKIGPILAWGNFTTVTLNFLIVAFCVFLLIKLVSVLRRSHEKEEAAKPPPEPTTQEKLLTEIRDLLKAKTP